MEWGWLLPEKQNQISVVGRYLRRHRLSKTVVAVEKPRVLAKLVEMLVTKPFDRPIK